MRIRPLVLLVTVVAGCTTDLETGYKPRPLGAASEADRRSYYAPAFSPAAKPDTGTGFGFKPQ